MKPSTGVDRRNRFLPPRVMVYQLEDASPGGWSRMPRIPLLQDTDGDQPAVDRADLRLAWTGEGLHVRAEVRDAAPVIRPDERPDSASFWKQDHIELRVRPDAAAELEQVQFLLAASGRYLAAGSPCPERVRLETVMRADGWTLEATVPFPALGVAVPAEGTVLRGLVAVLRWAHGYPEIACCSACELGFAQAERHAELVLAGAASPPVRLDRVAVGAPAPDGPSAYARAGWWAAGENDAVVTLLHTAQRPWHGELLVTRETDPDALAHTRVFAAGETVPVPLVLERTLYTRFHFRWRDGVATHDLGAVTLRASVPARVQCALERTHPDLFFGGDDLAGIRAKAAMAPFDRLCRSFGEAVPDARDLPGPDGKSPLILVERDGGWLRVARESLIRDGAGGKRPAARHIWGLLTEDEQSAWREIDATTDGSPAARKRAIASLNRLLVSRDFHATEAFGGQTLPAEGQRLLARGVAALDDGELLRLNRMLLGGAIECIHDVRADLAARPHACFARWLVTNDPEWITHATRAVRAANQFMIVGPGTDLHPGGASAGLGIAYDAFRPHLGTDDRRAWVQLGETMLDLHLYTARRQEWNCTTVPNANPVCNGGGGLLAMAMLDDLPDKAHESLYWARRLIRHWLDYCNGPDGGNTEGAQYWQYGNENFLRFAVALERLLGHDDGLLDHPAIRNAMNMIRVSLTNDGALHGVNDTIPIAKGAGMAWFLAGRHHDAFGLWYGDHCLRMHEARRAAGKATPYHPSVIEALLYRPAVAECVDQPALPTAFMLPSIQYGILRSGPAYDCRWTAGLKGSRPPYTHHNQPDTGSFFVHLRGERLLIDPGYYKGRPEDHCLLRINGQPDDRAPVAYTGRLTACAADGDLRYLACDATAAYAGAADRVVRHLVMAGEEALILLDDVVCGGGVTAWYQAGGETAREGEGSIMISGQRARLRMDLLAAPGVDVDCRPERPLDDVHWGYSFADCRLFPVAARYAAQPERPLVTVFQDATVALPAAPSVALRERALQIGLPSGRWVTFVRTAGGWRFDAF